MWILWPFQTLSWIQYNALCSSCWVLFICFYRFGWHLFHVWTFHRVIGFVRQPLDLHLTRIAPQVNFSRLHFLTSAIVLAVNKFLLLSKIDGFQNWFILLSSWFSLTTGLEELVLSSSNFQELPEARSHWSHWKMFIRIQKRIHLPV